MAEHPPTVTPVHALTVRQPWATLIVVGVKPVENRSWPAPAKVIGERIGIHAGKAHMGNEFRAALIYATLLHGDDEPGNTMAWIRGWWANRDLDYGALIGSAVVTGCHRDCDPACSTWAVKGDWHWTLADPHEFRRPVSMNGRLGIWNPALNTPGGAA